MDPELPEALATTGLIIMPAGLFELFVSMNVMAQS